MAAGLRYAGDPPGDLFSTRHPNDSGDSGQDVHLTTVRRSHQQAVLLERPVLMAHVMVRLTIALDGGSARGVQELLEAFRFLMIATRLEPGCQGCSAWVRSRFDRALCRGMADRSRFATTRAFDAVHLVARRHGIVSNSAARAVRFRDEDAGARLRGGSSGRPREMRLCAEPVLTRSIDACFFAADWPCFHQAGPVHRPAGSLHL